MSAPWPAERLFAAARPVRALVDLFATICNTSAELGHWLEICHLERGDIEFFSAS